jgi:hypothetical protein
MKKKLLAAFIVTLAGVAACGTGYENCTISGLTPGYIYAYSYVDEYGHRVGGDFLATETTKTIENVPTSSGCDISLDVIIMPVQPPVA